MAVTAERDSLLIVLREKGRTEGDTSLGHQVAIWRARAELSDQRQAAAEAALSALRGHWIEAPAEIDAWKRATNQPTRSKR